MPKTNTPCPPGLCMSSKPGCKNRGGKVIQVKPRNPKSDDEKMRCCGEETCEMPSSSKRLQEQETQKCPTGICLESKPTCTRNGGKVIQVKPRDEDSKDPILRCCGVQKCKMPHVPKKGKHCCKAPGIKTPKLYHRKCPPQMKLIDISKCKPDIPKKEDIKTFVNKLCSAKTAKNLVGKCKGPSQIKCCIIHANDNDGEKDKQCCKSRGI